MGMELRQIMEWLCGNGAEARYLIKHTRHFLEGSSVLY